MITKTTTYAIYGIKTDAQGNEMPFGTDATVSPMVKSSRDIENWELTLASKVPGAKFRITQFFPVKTKYKLSLSRFKIKK